MRWCCNLTRHWLNIFSICGSYLQWSKNVEYLHVKSGDSNIIFKDIEEREAEQTASCAGSAIGNYWEEFWVIALVTAINAGLMLTNAWTLIRNEITVCVGIWIPVRKRSLHSENDLIKMWNECKSFIQQLSFWLIKPRKINDMVVKHIIRHFSASYKQFKWHRRSHQ